MTPGCDHHIVLYIYKIFVFLIKKLKAIPSDKRYVQIKMYNNNKKNYDFTILRL